MYKYNDGCLYYERNKKYTLKQILDFGWLEGECCSCVHAELCFIRLEKTLKEEVDKKLES